MRIEVGSIQSSYPAPPPVPRNGNQPKRCRIRIKYEERAGRCRGEVMRKFRLNFGVVVGLYLLASIAWADSLELKNGSLIKGKFMGGTESEISFQVGSSVQKYNLADIVSLKFDSERAASDLPARPSGSLSSDSGMAENPSIKAGANVTI